MPGDSNDSVGDARITTVELFESQRLPISQDAP